MPDASVALRGNLEDFGIADVFQLIGQQRKTGILELRGEGGHVELRFVGGSVVSAAPMRAEPHAALGEMLARCGLLAAEQVEELRRESEAAAQSVPVLAIERGWVTPEQLQEIEDLLTRETFFAILRWRSGAFDFRAQAVEHARPVDSLHGAEQILMDGLRMLDEWQSFAHAVPSEDLVFEPVGDFAAWRAAAGASAVPAEAAERVFLLLDGRSNVRQVIDRSRLGTFDAVRALAELRRAGLANLQAPMLASRAPAAAGRSGRAAARTVATAVPLLLLLLAAGAALHARSRAPEPPGFPIVRSPLAEARTAFATRGARHALEAVRFESGAWPESLDARAMAAPGGRPYYYARRGDGALLLAPER